MTDDRARVLIIVENLSMPFDRRAWREAESLARAGYQVSVISPKGDSRDDSSREVIDGIAIYRYRSFEARSGLLSYLIEYGHAVLMILVLSFVVHFRRGFDVIQICNPPDVLFLAIWPFKLIGKKIIFDHHDLSPELYLAKDGGGRRVVARILLALERQTFRFADVVISANDSYKALALSRGGQPESKVFVVRNGPELKRIRSVEPDPSLRQGKEHLLSYVGMMGSQDGVDYLLRSIRILSTELGRDDFHVIVMGGGPELPYLERYARELGVDHLMTFTGLMADPDRLYRGIATASVCLCPDPMTELNDNSTMAKVLEYMAFGKPVVAFDLKETRVSAGAGALYVTPNEEEEFARRIDELLDSPELRERLGRIGRERIHGGLAWDHSEKQLLAAYETALNGVSPIPRPD
jgi:glycosyltransferase involved in cell wall biosynthesis